MAEVRLVFASADAARAARSEIPAWMEALHAPAGRSSQQNAGAAAASGDWLWFVHADSALRAGTLPATQFNLALSVEYQFNRTNRPPEGVAPDDRLFKTGLIINF